MPIVQILQKAELFSGLVSEQVAQIASLVREEVCAAGDVILREGESSGDLFVVGGGAVEILVSSGAVPDVHGAPQLTPLVRLGKGQLFGEMSLVDQGVHSATVRCVEDGTVLYAIPHELFWRLCDNDHHIGYVVMRNVASDLAFKLRHRNLRTRLAGGTT